MPTAPDPSEPGAERQRQPVRASAVSDPAAGGLPDPVNLDDLLEPFARRGIDMGLERMRQALAAGGHPERRFAAVQVAGTNGKGSIATQLHAILRAAGLRCGIYRSPHLQSWCERIQLDDRWIDAQQLRDDLARWRPIAANHNLTPFELLTAAAFDRFAAADLDLTVLEVGLGGRLDATTAHPRRLVVGFGAIGQRVATLLKAFGCRVIATRRTGREGQAGDIELMPLERLLEEADVVSLHCPLNHETAGLIDRAALARMKRHAVLVNVARGGVVNEADLYWALKEKIILAAATDVFETEPLPANSPLLELDNLVVSPHLAAIAADNFIPTVSRMLANIARIERGEPLPEQDRVVG